MKTKATFFLSLVFLLATAFTTPAQQGEPGNKKYIEDMGMVMTLYAMWDQNLDRMISQTEWENALNHYLNGVESNQFSFSEFDKDENSQWDVNEFRLAIAGLEEDHLRQIFDRDPAQVVTASTYEVWNSDDDAMIEKVSLGEDVIEYDADDN
jgi:hypothetical protein